MGVVESNPPLWFLRSIFVVEILFYLLEKCRVSNAKAAAAVYLVFAAEFLAGWSFYTRTVNGLLFYALGYLFRRTGWVEKLQSRRLPLCLAAGGGFFACSMYVYRQGWLFTIATSSHLLPFLLTTHLGILFAGSLSMCLSERPVLEYMGRNSLVILCTHVLVKDAISVMLKLVWKNDSFMDTVSNGYAMLTTVVICALCCLAAEAINRFCPFLLGKLGKRIKT